MALTTEQIIALEAGFDTRFGPAKWGVDVYTSPAERKINKPILPETDRTTGRMGHMRNWEEADVALVEAWFIDIGQHLHTLTFKTIEEAVLWLDKQNISGVIVYV